MCAVKSERPLRIRRCTKRTFRCAGRHGVDAAQQQRMVRQQQSVVGDFVDDRRRGVHRDGHRIQHILGITAHQADRIP